MTMQAIGLVIGPADILTRLPQRDLRAVKSWVDAGQPATKQRVRAALSKVEPPCQWESVPDTIGTFNGNRVYLLFVYRSLEERRACFTRAFPEAFPPLPGK